MPRHTYPTVNHIHTSGNGLSLWPMSMISSLLNSYGRLWFDMLGIAFKIIKKPY